MSTTKSKHDRKKSTRKIIRFPDDLLKRIKEVDMGDNFSRWVINACKDKLKKE